MVLNSALSSGDNIIVIVKIMVFVPLTPQLTSESEGGRSSKQQYALKRDNASGQRHVIPPMQVLLLILTKETHAP